MLITYFGIVILQLLSLEISESFVCEPPSVYHNHTRMCVRLVHQKLNYVRARSYCEMNFTGGPDRQTPGHLMFIYDKETNNFIKSMLRAWNIQEALLGLHDAALYGHYRWDSYTKNATYYDWATPSYVEDKTKRAVVATADGWRKHPWDTPADFICQSEPVLPEIDVACPPTTEGKNNYSLRCRLETYEASRDLSIEFCRDNAKNSCARTKAYTIRKSINDTNIKTQLKISTVRRNDEGTWTCFTNLTVSSGTHQINRSCDVYVYVLPDALLCGHQPNATHVSVTCATRKVYPQPTCVWTPAFDTLKSQMLEIVQHDNYTMDQVLYFNTTCTAIFKPATSGLYSLLRKMFPKRTLTSEFKQMEQSITLGLPECPGQLDIKRSNAGNFNIWEPGHNGGLAQSFVIYRHNGSRFKVEEAALDDKGTTMVYSVQNLVTNTHHAFCVQVKNNLGVRDCPHLNFHVYVADQGQNIFYPSLLATAAIVIAALIGVVAIGRKKGYLKYVICKQNTSAEQTHMYSNVQGQHSLVNREESSGIEVVHVTAESQYEIIGDTQMNYIKAKTCRVQHQHESSDILISGPQSEQSVDAVQNSDASLTNMDPLYENTTSQINTEPLYEHLYDAPETKSDVHLYGLLKSV